MQNIDKQNCNILYVDDELNNLKAFQASFRRDYNVFTASNGDDGLKIFEENDIQVIVTDQRMPGMTGVQFLQHLSDEPDNIRIILTGYSDMEAIIEAINTGKVYRYITKPWDKNELKITLDNALETVMLRRSNKQLIHELQEYSQGLEEKVKQRTAEIEEHKDAQLRTQIEFALKEKEAAEQTARLRHQFMANMSHEIRTPMNAIVGMTRLLLTKDPRPDQIRYLNPIRLSANNLLVIINDILDLSKIEAGKIVIEQTGFSLAEIMDCLHEMMVVKADEKNLEFRISIDKEIPQMLSGDPTRLNQVLINLTGNSIKFTKQGYVELSARLINKEGGKLWIRFDVTDTGIGIGPEYIDSIFERFTQAGADVSRKFGGTGLGLTISKQLVNLMGGEITVQSELGKGTTFSVTIPLEEAVVTEETAQSASVEVVVNRLANLRILLAEDNEFNRMVAEDTLKDLIPGITIESAINGQDAIEKLKHGSFDIVLMDIQMPVMDGLTATKLIRETLPPPARNVKIIAMTANVLQDDVQHYSESGMNAFVSKPFIAEELVKKLNEVLEAVDTAPLVKKEDKQNGKEELPPLPEKVTDTTFLERFTGGNMEKQRKYIGMFLENSPVLLHNAETALADGDFERLKIAVHSLRPQLSYMGIKEEVSNISQIEHSCKIPSNYESLPALVYNLVKVCNKAFEELHD
jgi:signal transduction histidine kinase/HPt (histidine-containing phosphotransfer) domain-containing protein